MERGGAADRFVSRAHRTSTGGQLSRHTRACTPAMGMSMHCYILNALPQGGFLTRGHRSWTRQQATVYAVIVCALRITTTYEVRPQTRHDRHSMATGDGHPRGGPHSVLLLAVWLSCMMFDGSMVMVVGYIVGRTWQLVAAFYSCNRWTMPRTRDAHGAWQLYVNSGYCCTTRML